MKFIISALVLFLSACLANAQNVDQSEVIQRIVNDGSVDGHYNKIIGDMGDASAVVVTKLIKGGHVGSSQIDNVLIVLDMSFADVAMISTSADREPRTALFVLKYLESCTSDSKVRERILETRNRIIDNFARYEKSRTHSETDRP